MPLLIVRPFLVTVEYAHEHGFLTDMRVCMPEAQGQVLLFQGICGNELLVTALDTCLRHTCHHVGRVARIYVMMTSSNGNIFRVIGPL